MNKEETKMIIKECIFEGVMLGNDIVAVLRSLHFSDGFEQDDIREAYQELLVEAGV